MAKSCGRLLLRRLGHVVPKPHLQALENALVRNGWRIVAVHPGENIHVAASWEIRRSTREPILFLDFDGLDKSGTFCLPPEQSYGCSVRGHWEASLYFRRINKKRSLWEQDLVAFIDALENAAIAA